MASVHRRADTPNWFAFYRDNSGRQVCKSTRTSDRKKALKIAEAFEGVYKSKNIKEYVRVTLNQLVRVLDPEANVPTVGEYFKQWMHLHGDELAERTKVSYLQRLNQFEEYIKSDKTMDCVRKSNALEFRKIISERSSNTTANNAMKVLSSVFGCAHADGIIIGNPFSKITKLPSDSISKQHFTIQQVERLLSVADPEWRSMILFAVYTAQRLGDICSLSFGQIDYEKKEILFTTEKTGRNMAIPAHDALWAHIMTLQRGLPASPVHPRAYGWKKETSIGIVSRNFYNLMVEAGLAKFRSVHKKRESADDNSREVSPLSFHSLRHATATWLRQVNVSESICMEIVGHDSKSVDRAYVAKTETERMRFEINKLPKLA